MAAGASRQQMSLQLVAPERSGGQCKEKCVAGVVQEAAKEYIKFNH